NAAWQDLNGFDAWRKKYALVCLRSPRTMACRHQPLEGHAMSSTAGSLPATPSLEAPERLASLELLLLGAIWGASFLFMRVAASDFGPVALVEVRLALGALVLLPFLWRARARFPLRLWPKLALIGAINAAVPFILFAWAAERAPAGIG